MRGNRKDEVSRRRLGTQRSGDYVITSGQGQPAPIFLPFLVGETDRINLVRERVALALAQLSCGGRQVQLILALEWAERMHDLMLEISALITDPMPSESGLKFYTPSDMRNERVITIAVYGDSIEEEVDRMSLLPPSLSFDIMVYVAMENDGKKLDFNGIKILGEFLLSMPISKKHLAIIAIWTEICQEYVSGPASAGERNQIDQLSVEVRGALLKRHEQAKTVGKRIG